MNLIDYWYSLTPEQRQAYIDATWDQLTPRCRFLVARNTAWAAREQ